MNAVNYVTSEFWRAVRAVDVCAVCWTLAEEPDVLFVRCTEPWDEAAVYALAHKHLPATTHVVFCPWWVPIRTLYKPAVPSASQASAKPSWLKRLLYAWMGVEPR